MSLTSAVRSQSAALVEYPDSDGEPMADNTEQFAFIQLVHANLDMLLPDFVAGDLLWYPVEGHPETRVAPDVYVAPGRPKGPRGAYKQWLEDDVAPKVVFEWWSERASVPAVIEQHRFYERHGVEEFYAWDQAHQHFAAYVRGPRGLEPVSTDDGWVSPLLGVRFEVRDDTLRMFLPDGTPFRTLREMAAERDAATAERDAAIADRDAATAERDAAQQARDLAERRAAALAQRLRDLGLDPDV